METVEGTPVFTTSKPSDGSGTTLENQLIMGEFAHFVSGRPH